MRRAAWLGCCGPLIAALMIASTWWPADRTIAVTATRETVTTPTVEAIESPRGADVHSPEHAVDSVAPAAVHDVTNSSTIESAEPLGSEVRSRGTRNDRTVALTFDDGPSGGSTRAVLRVLAHHRVPATFFVLGRAAERDVPMLAAIAAGGHEIGNHAHSHISFRSLFPSQIHSELDRTADVVENATGLRPRFVRPPYGRYPPSYVDLARERGEDIVLWSVDANDWAGSTPESIAAGVVAAAEPGSVILLHDTAPHTVEALPIMLAGLARRGFTIVPLSELLDRPAWTPE